MRTSADHAEYDYHAGPPDEMVQAEQIAAELAELEREIGRTAIRNVILHGAKHGAMGDYDAMWIIREAISGDEEPFGILTLIARWRQLHAGAEGATDNSAGDTEQKR